MSLSILMKNLEQTLQPMLDALGGVLWGWPMLILLMGTGLLYTVMLGGLQFRLFGHAFAMVFRKAEKDESEGDISHFQALMTAMCATVGTGNIAGVATAIAAGGPGALFWMWLVGLVGMATKYAEAVLGVHYRVKNRKGEMSGGPMYYISQGLHYIPGAKIVAGLFCVLIAISALGAGNLVQGNSVADILNSAFNLPTQTTGIVLALLSGLVILGGIKRIAQTAEAVVPLMIVLYIGAGVVVLAANITLIPAIFAAIFDGAFTGTAAAGGFAGAAVAEVMRLGLSRGVFSNESGCGSSPIAAAAAKTKHPVEQALVSMTQTFVDTIVVCTFTGLVILVSGQWLTGATGATLTGLAFNQGFDGVVAGVPMGSAIVAVCLTFFAFTTIIGWSYYGLKGITWLFGEGAALPYKMFYVLLIPLGAIIQVPLAWNIAEICFGLMIIPNVLALLLLFPKVRTLTNDYLNNLKTGKPYAVKPFANK